MLSMPYSFVTVVLQLILLHCRVSQGGFFRRRRLSALQKDVTPRIHECHRNTHHHQAAFAFHRINPILHNRYHPSKTLLFTSNSMTHNNNNNNNNNNPPNEVQFLGQGIHASIQPGVVLVAPSYEYSHFLKHAAIFIYAMGTDEVYKDTVIRGVLLDHPTAFNMGEMCPGSVYGPLTQSTLFTGGNQGKDSVLLFHSLGGVGVDTTTPSTSSQNPLYTVTSQGHVTILHNTKKIGSSGIYQGGIQALQEILNQGILDDPHVQFQYPQQHCLFKFFFNYIQFTQEELQLLLLEKDPENKSSRSHDDDDDDDDPNHHCTKIQDVWTTVQVPPSFILRNDWDRGEAWAYLKNYLSTLETIS